VAIMAANALLDRGYGKPAQMLTGDPEKPLEYNIGVVDAFTQRIPCRPHRPRTGKDRVRIVI
jgi:hypothetical protein